MNRVDKDTNAAGGTGLEDVAEPSPAPDGTGPEDVAEPSPARDTAGREDLPDTADADGGGEDAAEAPPPGIVEEAPTLEDEVAALQDRLLRQAAEFQNYRRRTEQEKARMMEFGKAAVVQELLDVVDDFERSIEAAHSAGLGAKEQGLPQAFAAFSDGVGLVYAKLRDALSRAGVEVIEAVGHPFDEHLHEALMRQPAAEGQAPGLVVGEIQKGYRMGDRVLRHAKVIVSA
jgi:molecular chaperone GrpE